MIFFCRNFHGPPGEPTMCTNPLKNCHDRSKMPRSLGEIETELLVWICLTSDKRTINLK